MPRLLPVASRGARALAMHVRPRAPAMPLVRALWTRAPRASLPVQHTLAYRVHDRPRRWWVRLRYALAVTTATLAAVIIYNSLVMNRLVNSIAEWLQSLPPDVLKHLIEASDEEDSYLPIPFTLRHIPPGRYARDSPERAALGKIAAHPPNVHRVLAEVKASVRKTLDLSYYNLLGPNITCHSTLSIDWETPPPWGRFYQKGIVWEEDEDGNSIGPRIYDFELPWEVGKAMHRTYYPYHVYYAVKAYLVAFVSGDLATLKQRFIVSDPQSPPSSTPPSPTLPFPPLRTTTSPAPLPTTSTITRQSTSALSDRSSAGPVQPTPAQRIERTVGPAIAGMHQRGADARKVFRAEYLGRLYPMPSRSLNGCLTVTGEIYYRGEKGSVTMWVYSWWDPQSRAVVWTVMERKRLSIYRRYAQPVQNSPK